MNVERITLRERVIARAPLAMVGSGKSWEVQKKEAAEVEALQAAASIASLGISRAGCCARRLALLFDRPGNALGHAWIGLESISRLPAASF